MVEERPLLTMVKSRLVDEPQPPLSSADTMLLETLSSLCSFMNTQDLASFLFSPMFRSLTGEREPFVVFEIGVFLDHTKIIELIASGGGIVLADVQMTGAFTNNVHSVENEEDAAHQLAHWHSTVYAVEN